MKSFKLRSNYVGKCLKNRCHWVDLMSFDHPTKRGAPLLNAGQLTSGVE